MTIVYWHSSFDGTFYSIKISPDLEKQLVQNQRKKTAIRMETLLEAYKINGKLFGDI